MVFEGVLTMPSRRSLHQPPLTIPLDAGTEEDAYTLGVVGLRCRVILHLESAARRTFVAHRFVVDSGASYSMIQVGFAMFHVGGSLATPPILGLGGVISTCRWTFDGRYSPNTPYGSLKLNDIR
jgi:hypothetical protein